MTTTFVFFCKKNIKVNSQKYFDVLKQHFQIFPRLFAELNDMLCNLIFFYIVYVSSNFPAVHEIIDNETSAHQIKISQISAVNVVNYIIMRSLRNGSFKH